MNLFQKIAYEKLQNATRRHFLRDVGCGMGALWFGLHGSAGASTPTTTGTGRPGLPHFTPKTKRIIYLHMVGAPSQLDLFDYKPQLAKFDGKDCPQAYLEGQRFAFIQGTPKLLGPQFDFRQHGGSGAWISDRFPHLTKHADDLCFIKTLNSDQFNHGPAQVLMHTGTARVGAPSLGAWSTWGLGSENENLPSFMVLTSGGLPRGGRALWGTGHLPGVYQGVQCRSSGDPILNIANPNGITRNIRKTALETLEALNKKTYEDFADPQTLTRIEQYEMAYRMQAAAPEVMDISGESEDIHELYGSVPGKASFANNCLLARRMAEAGVRFIQLYDTGWDSHGAGEKTSIRAGFKDKCRSIDQPISALLTDLKQRGLLDDTLVIWGSEFGRTPMQENRGGRTMKFVGRDHNPNTFTVWMCGAGVKPGITYGETDEIGYFAADNPVSVHDFQATLLKLLGFDHTRLTYPFQGANQRLTNITKGGTKVVHDILA